MKLKSVRATNFMSLRDVSLDLDFKGLSLVTGRNEDNPGASSNGSGKSALLDSISWCLFGKTMRGTEGDGVVSRSLEKGCLTEVTILNDEGTWTVRRYRKHPEGKNALKVFRDGKDVSADRVADAQEQVNRLLGMDFETFASSVVFGQDSLRFLGLSDSEKKAVLSKLLRLESLERALENVRSDKRRVDAEIGQKSMDLRTNEALYRTSLENVQYARSQRAEWEEDRRKRVAALEDEIKRKPSGVHEKLMNEARERIVSIQAEIDKVEKTRDAWFKSDAVDRERIAKLNASASAARNREADLLRELRGLKDACPTCKRDFDKSGIEAARARLNADIEDAAKEAAELERSAKAIKRKEEPKGGIDLKVQLRQQQKTLDDLNQSAENERRWIETRKFDLERLRCEKNPHDDKKYLESLERNSAASITDRLDLERAKDGLGELEFAEMMFGAKGVPSHLMDVALAYLEERANHYLDVLTGGVARVAFSAVSILKGGGQADTISCKVAMRGGADEYESLSGGERQRIDVAVSLALFDLSRSRSGADLGFVAFDEVFERLDEAGCESVAHLLAEEAPRWGATLILTHQTALLAQFGTGLTVVKKNGVSSILGHEASPLPEPKKRRAKVNG